MATILIDVSYPCTGKTKL